MLTKTSFANLNHRLIATINLIDGDGNVVKGVQHDVTDDSSENLLVSLAQDDVDSYLAEQEDKAQAAEADPAISAKVAELSTAFAVPVEITPSE